MQCFLRKRHFCDSFLPCFYYMWNTLPSRLTLAKQLCASVDAVQRPWSYLRLASSDGCLGLLDDDLLGLALLALCLLSLPTLDLDLSWWDQLYLLQNPCPRHRYLHDGLTLSTRKSLDHDVLAS